MLYAPCRKFEYELLASLDTYVSCLSSLTYLHAYGTPRNASCFLSPCARPREVVLVPASLTLLLSRVVLLLIFVSLLQALTVAFAQLPVFLSPT